MIFIIFRSNLDEFKGGGGGGVKAFFMAKFYQEMLDLDLETPIKSNHGIFMITHLSNDVG